MRISDWSSVVCSSDLGDRLAVGIAGFFDSCLEGMDSHIGAFGVIARRRAIFLLVVRHEFLVQFVIVSAVPIACTQPYAFGHLLAQGADRKSTRLNSSH